MRLWTNREGFDEQPFDYYVQSDPECSMDAYLNVGEETPFSTLVNDEPTLKRYLTQVPEVKSVLTEEWFYDNNIGSKPKNNYQLGGDYKISQ